MLSAFFSFFKLRLQQNQQSHFHIINTYTEGHCKFRGLEFFPLDYHHKQCLLHHWPHWFINRKTLCLNAWNDLHYIIKEFYPGVLFFGERMYRRLCILTSGLIKQALNILTYKQKRSSGGNHSVWGRSTTTYASKLINHQTQHAAVIRADFGGFLALLNSEKLFSTCLSFSNLLSTDFH